MRDLFQKILNEYRDAYNENSTKHPAVTAITVDIPSEIEKIIIEKERFKIKGTKGVSNLPAIPWIAIFDVLVTQSAQSGYYPVFLFKDDMSGFYLSLNQGVTHVVEKYKKNAKDVLLLLANDYRAQIGLINSNFNQEPIQLKSLKSTKTSLATLYSAGNILSKYYESNNIPSNFQLQTDILEMLKIYEMISYNEGLPTTEGEIEDDEKDYKAIQDLRKFRFHKRIERNITLSKKVKKVQGYRCKACELDFTRMYGELGKDFIEAHHLKPISKLTGEKIELDARKDFTVLCSNCHSMIHRLDDPSNLEELKRIIKAQQK